MSCGGVTKSISRSSVGSPRSSADASEGPCTVEVILNVQVPTGATNESSICLCSSQASFVSNLKFPSVFLKLAGKI